MLRELSAVIGLVSKQNDHQRGDAVQCRQNAERDVPLVLTALQDVAGQRGTKERSNEEGRSPVKSRSDKK